MAETGSDDRHVDDMVRRIRWQAGACREMGSPLYHHLLSSIADDVLAGGPARDLLRGHEQDPGPSALALRLMGGVHRLVLERRAPALALTFPSVGGNGDADSAWAALRDVLVEHRDELRGWLNQPPQTNEVGRSAALVGGLLHLVARRPGPVRLVEIGASAGLNLRADRYRVELSDGSGVGPEESPVRFVDPWRGPLPPLDGHVDVVERAGCDVSPIDPTGPDGRLLLTSYVWPDQQARLDRLRGAFEVAAAVPAVLERSGAADYVDRLELRAGVTTVLWHSIMWQYLDRPEGARVTERIDELGAEATESTGFAHLSLEPRRRAADQEHEVVLALRVWPGGEEHVLGTSSAHGPPVTWE